MTEDNNKMPDNENVAKQANENLQNNAKLNQNKKIKNKNKKGFWFYLGRIFAISTIFILLWVIILRFAPVPFTILMINRALEGDKIKYHPVSINNISRHLIDSAIAAEDSRFCLHQGFEIEAMKRALNANKKGKKLRGASTISQQTAKNVFLWPARSYVRKGFEAGFTILIEFFWPKRRIMEAYLNVAEMGNGVFGAEAASRYYFKKSAKNLTPIEAARLAAILPSPQKWRVVKPGPYVFRRANSIVRGARVVRDAGLDNCIYK